MSKICLLCGENATSNPHYQLCDPCFDNAGNYVETNIRSITSIPYLLDAAYLALAEIDQWNDVMQSEDPRTAVAIDALRDAIRRAHEKNPQSGSSQANRKRTD